MFGPLPPSPPSSSPEETDGFPPLPPSPLDQTNGDSFDDDAQVFKIPTQSRGILDGRYRDTLDHPPAIPPHRGPPPTLNTLKTRYFHPIQFVVSIVESRPEFAPISRINLLTYLDLWMPALPNAIKIVA